MSLALEDNFEDVLGKSLRGTGIADEILEFLTGVPEEMIGKLKDGEFDEEALRSVASPLGLDADTLVERAKGSWTPEAVQLDGLQILERRCGFAGAEVDVTVVSGVHPDLLCDQAGCRSDCLVMTAGKRKDTKGDLVLGSTRSHLLGVIDEERFVALEIKHRWLDEADVADRVAQVEIPLVKGIGFMCLGVLCLALGFPAF